MPTQSLLVCYDDKKMLMDDNTKGGLFPEFSGLNRPSYNHFNGGFIYFKKYI